MIGRRIVVYGPSCSGKTTVAGKIAQHNGVPHVELDAVFWKPGWVEKPLEEFRADVSALLNRHVDGWVFDGNYSNVRDLILPLADTIVWLRLPFRIVYWRALKRTVRHILRHTPLWGHSYATFRRSFLSRESLLLYIIMKWRHYKLLGQSLQEIPYNVRIIELHSQRDIENFLIDLNS